MARLVRIVLVALLSVGGLQLLAAGPALAAPINDTPMTGNLPACPSGMAAVSPSPVFTNATTPAGYGELGPMVQVGLLNNCANGNWQDQDTSTYETGAIAKATPDTFSINNTPHTVNFDMSGVGAQGGFNTDYPSCMPLSTRAGGCTDPQGSSGGDWTTPMVAYRIAQGDGSFLGPWTLAGLPGAPNPYFDLTRGSCPNQHAEWDAGYEDLGFPCTWTLNFVTDVNGKPNLTSAMQVVVAAHGRSGTATSGGVTGPEDDVEATISMLFQPGASTSVKLDTSANVVPYGKKLSLTATTVGAQPGAQVGFYSKVGSGPATLLGTAATGADKRATLTTKLKQTASYYAALVAGGVQTVKSSTRKVLVKPKLSLKVKHQTGPTYTFSASTKPAVGGITVVLQKRVGAKWKKAASGKTKGGKVTFSEPVPSGGTFRLFVAGSASYAESTSKPATV